MKKIWVLLWISVAVSCNVSQNTDTTQPTPVGTLGSKAMVSSAHPLATQVGYDILKKGGNAYDAAIAVQFALAVVFPRAGNIGGGGVAVIRDFGGQFYALDFREKAPSLATRDMYLDKEGNVIEGLSTNGHLAVGVPGSVAGMWEIFIYKGSLSWEELIQPSIDLAKKGFELTARGAQMLNEKQESFKRDNNYQPWVIRETPWKKGDKVIQEELGATLEIISKKGLEGFYQGKVADLIVDEMKRGGGLISKQDLLDYKAKWRTPVVGNYKDYKIVGMPPPSSGGIAIMQLFYGAEKLNVAKEEMNSPTYIHLLSEIEKRVFADRIAYIGDSDFITVPFKTLLSKDYLDKRFENIDRQKATPSSEIAAGDIPLESEETTHFSVLDEKGNALSITTTLNGNMGSHVMVKGAGFFLNNEMDDFSSKPGAPNMFGIVGSKANEIQPNKRMVSSMTPIIAEKDKKLKLILGTPGGSTIITSVFQVFLHVIDRNMTLQAAINQPRFHHQWYPEKVFCEENRVSNEIFEGLKKLGHDHECRPYIGRVNGILINEDGTIEGAADSIRSDGVAMGF